jgi:hypothetical protein
MLLLNPLKSTARVSMATFYCAAALLVQHCSPLGDARSALPQLLLVLGGFTVVAYSMPAVSGAIKPRTALLLLGTAFAALTAVDIVVWLQAQSTLLHALSNIVKAAFFCALGAGTARALGTQFEASVSLEALVSKQYEYHISYMQVHSVCKCF